MKYGRYLIAVLLIIVIAMSGCQSKAQEAIEPQKPADLQPTKTIGNNNDNKTELETIFPSNEDPRKAMIMTKLREFSYDMDGDNTEETIELYTAAGRDDKGQMMWDDGQQWLLLIQDGDSFYPLLSQFVQLGQVYFNVAVHGDEELPRITLTVSTGSILRLSSYIYDSGKKGYTGELLYESKTICEVFTSIPSY